MTRIWWSLNRMSTQIQASVYPCYNCSIFALQQVYMEICSSAHPHPKTWRIFLFFLLIERIFLQTSWTYLLGREWGVIGPFIALAGNIWHFCAHKHYWGFLLTTGESISCWDWWWNAVNSQVWDKKTSVNKLPLKLFPANICFLLCCFFNICCVSAKEGDEKCCLK